MKIYLVVLPKAAQELSKTSFNLVRKWKSKEIVCWRDCKELKHALHKENYFQKKFSGRLKTSIVSRQKATVSKSPTTSLSFSASDIKARMFE